MEVLSYGLPALCVGVLYAAALTGTGLMLGRALLGRRDDLDVATAFSIGLGLYGGLWVLLGLWGTLRAAPVLALLAPGGIAVAWGVRGRMRRPRWPGWPVTVLAVLTAVVLAMTAVAALRPPMGDAIAFYMAWSKVIAASGVIVPLPGYEGFSSVWMLVEAHLAAVTILGGEPAAKLFVWMSLLAAASASARLAAEIGCGGFGRVVASAVVVTSSAVLNVAHDGKTDLVAVAPALASALWLLRLGASGSWRIAAVSGWLAGTAAAAKLSYIPPLGAALVVLLIARSWAGTTPVARSRRLVAWAGAAGLGAGMAVLPQIVKNGMLFTPLAPFLGKTFTRDVWYTDATTAWILKTYPLALTYGSYWAQHGNLSPLVLGFLPLLPALWPRRSDPSGGRARLVLVASVAGLFAWIAVAPSQHAPRYFLGPLLLFAAPTAWLAERAWLASGPLLRSAVAASVAFALLLTAVDLGPTAHEGVRYARAKAADGDAGCLDGYAYCDVARRVDAQVRPGERLVFLSYYRYYLRPDILQCLLSVGRLGTLDAQTVSEFGVDHLLVDRLNFPTNFPVDPAVAELVHEDPAFLIYRVHEEYRKAHRMHCVEVAPDRWVER